ncbi:MAG TPA: Asp-tRNA(Asn)/Glu-tRNA(Gln) amidotransferase subunit GatC [Bacteroidota bacterium]|nr:Asp-tRNA(Asn)/Glu-tRNA(Gln) amidotransferase subunit GatC [Bacteroidota bacterium]
MEVTVEVVEHIAKLARLEFTQAEKEMFTHQLNSILAHMEQLNKIDTSGVEPLAQVVETKGAMREDVVRKCLTTEEALKNAPARTEQFFKVPKVIGEKEG